ncbi:unnamed protein product, partial [Polarella glacialis]
VVDFTRGGFVIGHMSEVEPGRFMLVIYVPEDSDEKSPDGGAAALFGRTGGTSAADMFSSAEHYDPGSSRQLAAGKMRGPQNPGLSGQRHRQARGIVR